MPSGRGFAGCWPRSFAAVLPIGNCSTDLPGAAATAILTVRFFYASLREPPALLFWPNSAIVVRLELPSKSGENG